MKMFLQTAVILALDLASTLVFLFVYLLSDNLTAAVVSGMVLGVAQLLWEVWHKRPIWALQWMSLCWCWLQGSPHCSAVMRGW